MIIEQPGDLETPAQVVAQMEGIFTGSSANDLFCVMGSAL